MIFNFVEGPCWTRSPAKGPRDHLCRPTAVKSQDQQRPCNAAPQVCSLKSFSKLSQFLFWNSDFYNFQTFTIPFWNSDFQNFPFFKLSFWNSDQLESQQTTASPWERWPGKQFSSYFHFLFILDQFSWVYALPNSQPSIQPINLGKPSYKKNGHLLSEKSA